MDMNVISSVSANTNTYNTSKTSNEKTEEKVSTKSSFSEEAAVYEKSSTKHAKETVKTVKNSKGDRSAIISQLKADQEAQKSQLFEIVKKTIAGQGNTLAQSDDMWKFLASGDFTVDAETKANAQAAIAEDGYWGVNQTSDRILDFAIALSGGDSSKAEDMLDAFKKGFSEATAAWGKDLPDISQKTYDAVLEKFEAWKNGEYEV